eukprot:TCONS_00021477-protein
MENQPGEVLDDELPRSSQTIEGTPDRNQNNNNNNNRRRMKWTKEMNVHIVRSYFIAIKTTPTTYRRTLHNLFIQRYGENFSEQRICDQKRQIFVKAENQQNQRLRGNWPTNREIDTIRQEVDQEHNQDRQVDEGENVQNENPPEIIREPEEPTNTPLEPPPAENDILPAGNEAQQVQERVMIQRDEEENLRARFEEHYFISKLTPFEKREKFRKPSKIDIKKLSRSCDIVNEIIDVNQYQCNDITQINDMTYAFAITAIEHSNLRKKCIVSDKITIKKTHNWIKRINATILELRKEISQIDQMNIANPSPKMRRNNERIKRKFNITNDRERKLTCERLKQKLLAKNNRLKRYKERSNQFNQNREFVNSPDKFYKKLRGCAIPITKAPSKQEIEDFWRPILGTESNFNNNAPWIADYEATIDIQPYEFQPITKEEMSEAIKNFANWKSPGIDCLQNYWWNKFESIHDQKVQIYNRLMDDPQSIPPWFTSGRTTLIPKKPQTEIPSNYRPITCLPITYKIMTSIITKRMKTHLTTFDLIPEEQKGGISGNQGTVDQLLIDNMILENARKSKRNLSTAWIDYRKAFDSVPHDWLKRSLQIHKFPEKLINFFTTTMTKWKTTLNISTQDTTVSSDPINIHNGIFQGDCPSGLNFVISLLPLSWLIKRSSIGYAIGPRNNRTVVSHLLFMDDLKLYANCDERLQDLLEIVSMFSKDICMSFGLDKCNTLSIRGGKLTKGNDIT